MNIPYLIWYAAEPLAEADPRGAISLAMSAKIPMIRDFMIRRVGSIGTPEAVAMLVDAAGSAPDDPARLAIVRGLNAALKGRRQVAMPATWPGVFAGLVKSTDRELKSQATALAITFGDPSARATMREVALDTKAEAGLRNEALAALLKVKEPGLAPTLRSLANDPTLRGPAIRGLAGYDDPETPALLLGLYPKLAAGDPSRRDEHPGRPPELCPGAAGGGSIGADSRDGPLGRCRPSDPQPERSGGQ